MGALCLGGVRAWQQWPHASAHHPPPACRRRVWEGPFSSDAHYNRSLAMLNDFVIDPDDWVVAADSDEFQEWGEFSIRCGRGC